MIVLRATWLGASLSLVRGHPSVLGTGFPRLAAPLDFSEKPAPLSTAYRPDIDGLRALSILLVVGYHARPLIVPGGFIGVDVFFVISGYLITRIILGQTAAGTFSFTEFYARRARRIFPALLVVLTVTYLVGWFVMLPEAFILLGKNMVAGILFVSNLFQLTQVGYFAPDAAENPLLHLWSLGIEEQFYILWPPLLYVLGTSQRQKWWMAGIAALSFGISLLVFFGHKEWSFYSPIPRAWELIVGALIARYHLSGRPQPWPRSPRLENALAVCGFTAIVVAGFGLNRQSLFPGINVLLPVIGAALLIVSPGSAVNSQGTIAPGDGVYRID